MQVSFVIPLYNRLDLTQHCLETLRATLPAGLAHEIVFVDDGSTDGTHEWLKGLSPPAVSRPNPPNAPPTPAVTGACLAVPRGLFARLGGFDEGFRNGGEDVDFCLRARAAGLGTWVALKSVVLHHVSATPGRKASDEENSYRLFRKWRAELEREAWRAWCETYLAEARAGALPRHPRAERCVDDFLQGRRPRPGRWAETNVAQSLFSEEARWERLLP